MFPRVPRISGNTDDENSVHLNSKVGPANPLPYRNYNQINSQIMDILDERYNNEGLKPNEMEKISQNEAVYLNMNFEKFQKNEKVFEELDIDSYVESSESDNESDDESDDEREKIGEPMIQDTVIRTEGRTTKSNDSQAFGELPRQKPANQSNIPKKDHFPSKSLLSEFNRMQFKAVENETSKKYAKYFLISFAPLLILCTIYFLQSYYGSNYEPISNITDINYKFERIEDRINDLSTQNNVIIEKNKKVSQELLHLRTLDSEIKRMEVILSGFKNENKNINFEKIEKDVKRLNSLILDKNESNSNKLQKLENEIDAINFKITKLEKINSDLKLLQSNLKGDILNELPNHIPVLIRNNKIEFLPEFTKFLISFIDSYASKNIMKSHNDPSNSGNDSKSSIQNVREMSWDQFLRQNKINLNDYFNEAAQNLRLINKNEFEKLISLKFKENNEFFNRKLNKLIESNKLLSNEKIDESYLRNLIKNLDNSNYKPISTPAPKMSKLNYADYKLGSRILGYVTSSTIYHTQRGFIGKVLLGWYDFLNNKDNKFNANNILLDGGNYWLTHPKNSYVGIRLSDSIILTDIILKNPIINNKIFENSSVASLSLYVKPMENFKKVKEIFSPQEPKKSKVPSNYVKIQDFELDERLINHLQISSKFIDLKIPVKDVLLEINYNHGNSIFTSLYNVKIYGYNDLDNYLNNNEIVHKLLNEKEQDQGKTRRHDATFEEIESLFNDIPLGKDEPY